MKNISSKFAFGIVISMLSIFSDGGTPIHEYMILRERAINAVRVQYSDRENKKLNETANNFIKNTQISLQKLVGPVNIDGFPGNGRGILGSRDDGQYDGLDGVAMTSSDGQTQLFVTTVPIMQMWLTTHRKDVDRYSSLSKLLGTENFYNATSTISGDAAVYEYGEIPVAANGRLVARAIIFALGQDDPAPTPPQSVAVTIMSDNRIYILTEAIAAPKISEFKSLSQQASISFERCFAKKISSQPEYLRLVDKAQRLVDRVPQVPQN